MPVDVPADLKAKQLSWKRQQAALGAPSYRITLTPRRDELAARNYRNEGHKQRGEPERFWSAGEVESFLVDLRGLNARGYDIYVTPIDEGHHYLVVDDIRAQKLKAMLAAGFQPCLIQESSADSQQAVLKVQKLGIEREQSIANRLVSRLNVEYGDLHFSGVVHPFRMAGFANRKPGRNNVFTRISVASSGLCPLATRMLAAEAAERAAAPASVAPEKKAARAKSKAAAPAKAPTGSAPAAFLDERAKTIAWVKRRGLEVNDSKVDFRAALAMLRAGWSRGEVEVALLASPDLPERHEDIIDYARRTVAAASEELASNVEG